jgi:hypothetical protein
MRRGRQDAPEFTYKCRRDPFIRVKEENPGILEVVASQYPVALLWRAPIPVELKNSYILLVGDTHCRIGTSGIHNDNLRKRS